MGRLLLFALSSMLVITHAAARDDAGLMKLNAVQDPFRTMQRDCAGAGKPGLLHCQGPAKSTDLALLNQCDEVRERARRRCMLDVMERQHLDIHDPIDSGPRQ